MTPEERAERIYQRLLRASMVAKRDIILCELMEAIEEDRAARECCKSKVEEEREACAKIVHEEYTAYVEGGFSASECFKDVANRIRARSS